MASNQPKEQTPDEQKFQTMCRSAFDEIDKDKSGTIDVKELEQALIKMSQRHSLSAPTKQDVQEALKIYDKNKDGKIQFQEFLDVTRESLKRAKKEPASAKDKKIVLDEKIYFQYLSASFDALDKDKNGFIDSKELTFCVEQFGKEAQLSVPAKTQVQKIIDKYDANQDRKIDYSEYSSLIGELYNIDVVSAGGHDSGELASGELHTGTEYQAVDEAMQQRIKLGDEYIRYIEETGLAMAFKIIFAEILSKKIPEDAAFAYTATRLRQIGEDIAYIQNSKYRKAPVKH